MFIALTTGYMIKSSISRSLSLMFLVMITLWIFSPSLLEGSNSPSFEQCWAYTQTAWWFRGSPLLGQGGCVVWLSVCPVCVLFVFCLCIIYLYDLCYSHARLSSCIYSTGADQGNLHSSFPCSPPCASSIQLTMEHPLVQEWINE
jgi:hypothetical protein